MKSKKEIIRSINTADNKKTHISLNIDGKNFTKIKENNWSSQEALPLIDKILMENKIDISDVTQIQVAEGPGSYTGLRVGVTIANTLGNFLNIPVNGKKGTLAIPKSK